MVARRRRISLRPVSRYLESARRSCGERSRAADLVAGESRAIDAVLLAGGGQRRSVLQSVIFRTQCHIYVYDRRILLAAGCIRNARHPMMRDLALTIMLAVSAAASAQSIVTVAGGGSDDARPALYVTIERPSRVAIDAAGNVYVSEGQRVRRLSMTTGIMTTMAGIVSPGILGDGGPATAAGLFNPEGIAFDRSGNLYI